MTDTILATLARLGGPNTRAAVERVTDAAGLMGSEPLAVQKAVPKRQAEFAAGRRAARAALAGLGHQTRAIPAGEDRAPIWPDTVVGAITHDAGLAAALVANTQDCTAIGLDMAEAAPFPVHLRDRILITQSERALGDLDARAVFSAKEALFKALYPSVRQFFGFEAAEVMPDLATETFTARLSAPLGDHVAGTCYNGRLAITDDRLLATLVILR